MTYFAKQSLLLALFTLLGTANSQAGNKLPIPLFQEDTTLGLTLSTNFDQVFADRKHEFPDRRTPQKASLYHNYNGVWHNLIFKTRARGWDRLRTCDFPPLKIEFMDSVEKSQTAFADAKNLKIVTRCDAKTRSRWNLREMVVYRMYEQMTPLSLKSRLTQITYKNRAEHDLENHNGKTLETHYAFILENTSQMAKRNGMKKVEVAENTGMDWKNVDSDLLIKIHLFEYMIFNMDYGILPDDMRNIEIVKDSSGKLYPVAYDFDFSEFVRDGGAWHQDYMKNKTFCYKWDQVAPAVPAFLGYRAKFEQVIRNSNVLTQGEKTSMLESMDRFYQMFGNGDLKKMVEKSWKKNSCSKKKWFFF